MSNDTVILAVAPISHELSPDIDYSPENVAREVVSCAKLGACVVHLHVRDIQGRQTENLDVYNRTVRLIREQSDIIIQGSTGGLSSLSCEQRSVSVDHPLTETASLNMGSVNFGDSVYINTIPEIKYWAGKMARLNVSPEMEVFDLSMIETAGLLKAKGLISKFVFNISLGFTSALSASERNLNIMRDEALRYDTVVWGLLHTGMKNMALLKKAVEMGADMIRVGFEDSVYISDKTAARDNAALVREAAGIIRACGREIATPSYARKKLGVKKL